MLLSSYVSTGKAHQVTDFHLQESVLGLLKLKQATVWPICKDPQESAELQWLKAAKDLSLCVCVAGCRHVNVCLRACQKDLVLFLALLGVLYQRSYLHERVRDGNTEWWLKLFLGCTSIIFKSTR